MDELNPIGVEGPYHSRILICGEAWGESEEKEKRPFVGRSGQVLDGILAEVGIPRALCRITNVIHERPSNNNFGAYYEGGKPSPKLLEAYARLANEISACQPNVVVCLGNEALRAVMGHGGILDWRGSILTSPSHGVKVIPTIHPAAILRDWLLRPCTVADFHKIAKESEYGEVRKTQRESIINPSMERALQFIEEAGRSEWLSVDIETETNQITCIGLAVDGGRAMCIPFWFGSSGSLWGESDEQLLWVRLKQLLESDSPKKITQNGMYEMEFLTRTISIHPKIHFDTMLGWHTLYPELPMSLAYLVSVYTDHSYYKFMRHTDNMHTLWEYNCLDAMLTYECAMNIRRELEEEKLLKFYEEYIHVLIEPLFSMMNRGVKMDIERMKALRKKLSQEVTDLQKNLDSSIGHPLNVHSHLQMCSWLYFELGLPKKTKKLKEPRPIKRLTKKADKDVLTLLEKWEYENRFLTLTSDDDALSELFRTTKNKALDVVLQIRERNKIISTYLEVKLDEDKRIRCTYNIAGTETGRLSSSATAFGTGTNLQNFPDGEVRSLLIPDEGYTFINADLSQAEARVVAYLAEDSHLLSVFGNGGDIHRKNASKMFGKPESEITKDERYLAKRAVHGLNYGMGYITFAKKCGIETAMARKVHNIYFTTFPRVKIWHMQIRSKLSKTRILFTPFGRRRIFFNQWGDSVLKEGLAFIPQSTVAEIVNQAIVKLASLWEGDGRKQLLLQVHDSILVQAKPEVLEETIKEIRETLTQPLEINGKIMVIPVDIKIGENWGELHETTYQTTKAG